MEGQPSTFEVEERILENNGCYGVCLPIAIVKIRTIDIKELEGECLVKMDDFPCKAS
jgi:hypothetical protein